MNSESGSQFSIRELGDLEWWCDLIEYEGPLLSLYHVENRRLFLEMWADKSGSANRWLLIRTTESNLRSYLGQRTSLKQLLENSPLILTYPRARGGRRKIRRVTVEDVAEYVPDENSLFEPRFATAA